MLGRIAQRSDGRLEGRDANGRLMGTYDPRRDETRDRNGALVGRGNQLSHLVLSP
jgi:hypothetical protein